MWNAYMNMDSLLIRKKNHNNNNGGESANTQMRSLYFQNGEK